MNTLPLFELKKIQSNFPCERITTLTDASIFIRQFFGDDIHVFESVFILLLNNNNMTIGFAKISQGGITGTTIDVRIVCKYAIESLATAVIIAHNHPSGNLTPSTADFNVTEKLKQALKTLDIQLLDHIILTSEEHYSMKENNTFP
jgi:DNA repair protein RadC